MNIQLLNAARFVLVSLMVLLSALCGLARMMTNLLRGFVAVVFSFTLLSVSAHAQHTTTNFTLNTTNGQACVDTNGTLETSNLFTELDGGSFGTGTSTAGVPDPDSFLTALPAGYAAAITGGVFLPSFAGFTHGNYAIISNMVTDRNTVQHDGIIHDPVNGAAGRFMVSDPNTTSPRLATTVSGLQTGESYEISYWVANSEPTGDPNNIGVFIDGVQIASSGPLNGTGGPTTTPAVWRKFSTVYTHTTASTSVQFAIEALETGASGRDLWLDEIRVFECLYLEANDDDFSSTPFATGIGGTTGSVFDDDTLEGSPFADADVIATVEDDDGLAGVTIGTDGTLTVPPSTPVGTYNVEYQICDAANPDRCDTAIATIVVNAPAPDIAILKSADTSGLSTPVAVGDPITFTFSVTNPGNVTLDLGANPITDTMTYGPNGGGAPVATPMTISADLASTTDTNGNGRLDPGDTFVYTATFLVDQATIDAGGVHNTATAMGNPVDESNNDISGLTDPVDTSENDETNGDGSDTTPDGNGNSPTVVTITANGMMDLEKTLTSVTQVFPYVYDIVFTIDAINNGNTTQTGIRIIDDLAAALAPSVIAATPVVTQSGFGGTPSLDGSYNGSTNVQLLAGNPTLLPGETGTVVISVRANMSPGYPAQGNTAYATTDDIPTPIPSDAPIVTPGDPNDTNPTPEPVGDLDDDGAPDNKESPTLDRDGDGIADADDYDPTGYFYCQEDGAILSGGLITVTGPLGSQTGVGTNANITIISDGSSGFYQWHVTAAGTYTMTYTLPTSGVASTDRFPAGTLDVTSLLPADPGVLGAGEIGSTGVLNDFTAAGNPFHVVFDIEAGDPSVFNNNIPLELCSTPEVTASKSVVGTPTLLASSATQVVYQAGITNSSETLVNNVTLTDDLDSVFGAGNYTVTNIVLISGPLGFTANAGFNGSGDQNLITTGNSLLPDETAIVQFTVEALPAAAGIYTNTVAANATSALTGLPIETDLATADIDVSDGTVLTVTKTSSIASARIGDVVPYTIVINNPGILDRVNVNIVDLMPIGFTYRPNSALVDGVAVEPVQDGRRLVWTGVNIPSLGSITVQVSLGVGAAAFADEFVNLAWIEDRITGERISTVGKAVVRREVEHVFDCGEVIGKVFDDVNRNGYQNEGERGLPGVRVVTVKGLLITTDKHGRYHVPCAAIPDAHIGSNFIVKLDERTLPSGFQLTTENPRVVRLTRGKFTKLNFGASIGRVIRIDLNSSAFGNGSSKPSQRLVNSIRKLIRNLSDEPSVLKVTYIKHSESSDLASARMRSVEKLVNERWTAKRTFERLNVETRIMKGR